MECLRPAQLNPGVKRGGILTLLHKENMLAK
jgi:hypothetical protein